MAGIINTIVLQSGNSVGYLRVCMHFGSSRPVTLVLRDATTKDIITSRTVYWCVSIYIIYIYEIYSSMEEKILILETFIP